MKKIKCDRCQEHHRTWLHDINAPGYIEHQAVAQPPPAASEGTNSTPTTQTTRTYSNMRVCVSIPLADDVKRTVVFRKSQLFRIRYSSDHSREIECVAMVDKQSRNTFGDERVVSALHLRPPECTYQLET